MQKDISNIEFIQGVDFEMINSLPNNGTNYLLIFDDSLEELSKSKEFNKLATAGRHTGLNAIYIKHNLFHKSSTGRDAELQNTHIVLFKSPRDVQQIGRLGQQLGLGNQFNDWYKNATSHPFGHLLVDLSPKTVDQLRFCSNSSGSPAKFYLPKSQARITTLDDAHTKHLYAQSILLIRSKTPADISPKLSKRVYSVPQRVYSKSNQRTTRKYKPKRRGNLQKTVKKVVSKKNNYSRKKDSFSIPKRYRSY